MKSSRLILILFIVVMNQVLYAQQSSANEMDLSKYYLRSQGITLTKHTGLTLGVYEYQAGELRILEIPLLIKLDLTDNFSLLGGGTFDFHQTRHGISNEFDASATFGIQFEPNKNSYIQGLFNYQMSTSNNPYSYKFGVPTSFSLRTGFKF